MLISFELGISMVFGYLVARFFAGSKANAQGKIPSLVIRFRTHKVHLHHWLLFSPCIYTSFVLRIFGGVWLRKEYSIMMTGRVS